MKLVRKRKCVEFPSSVDDAAATVPFDLWANLLPEMLVKIVRYLKLADRSQAALVCRKWRAAVYVPCLWNKMTINVPASSLTESTISTLVDRGIRRVEIWTDDDDFTSNCRSGIDRQIGELVAAMTDIEHLDVSECSYALKGLSLANAIRPTVLVALKYLNVARRKSITGRSLEVIVDCCPNIEELDLTRCLRNKSDTRWPRALCRLSKLRRLNLSECLAVNSTTIELFVTSAPLLLESLVLDYNDELTDEAVGIIVDGLPQLSSLSIKDCCCLTALASTYLSRMSLQQLDIGLDDDEDEEDEFRQEDEEIVCNLRSSGVLMKTIQTLGLNLCVFDEGICLFTPSVCPNLVSLSLFNAAALTDEGLLHVTSIKTLKVLALHLCLSITDVGIGYLVSGQLTQLESLDLERSDLQNWTDETHTLSSVERVNLADTDISEVGLRNLVRGFPRLKWLGLGGCTSITVRSLGHIATGLQQLEAIDLSDHFWMWNYSPRELSSNNNVNRLLQLPRLRCIALDSDQIDFYEFIATRRPDINILIDDYQQFDKL